MGESQAQVRGGLSEPPSLALKQAQEVPCRQRHEAPVIRAEKALRTVRDGCDT